MAKCCHMHSAVDNMMAFVQVCTFYKFLPFVFFCLSDIKQRTEAHPIVTAISLINITCITKANNENISQLFVEISGNNLHPEIMMRPTSYSSPRNDVCLNETSDGLTDNAFTIIWLNNTNALMTLIPSKEALTNRQIFICVKTTCEDCASGSALVSPNSVFNGEVIKWIHQGENVTLKMNSSYCNSEYYSNEKIPGSHHNLSRWRRDGAFPPADVPKWPPSEMADGRTPSSLLHLTGLRVESADREPILGEDGVVELLAGSRAMLRLFGTGITPHTQLTVTSKAQKPDVCQYPDPSVLSVEADSVTNSGSSALVKFHVPMTGKAGTVYYFCVKENNSNLPAAWRHQGDDAWLRIRTYEKLLPTWLSITIIVVCLSFSALFSGLNLGLMSMDQTDLKIVANTGSEQERRYAKAIMPVRKTGNYLLCSILLGNVLVNSTLTILLDDLTSGLVAVIGSTMAIVIFGEISPQAVCSRHGLAVGAKTIYITKLVMLITFPLSFPISKLLDRLLGVELGNVYNRERLKELVKVTNEYNDLEKDEVNIISGALEFRRKIVAHIMTKLEDVFMLSNDAVLDFETVSEIMKQGYSRIPVFEGVRSNIVTVLYIKDLAFVDPDDNTPLKTLCNFYQNPCNFVFEDTTLDVMFKQFKEGIKGHMAIVQRVNNEGEGDPFYETIGIVTLEDVIEELIQSEIVDETDVWTDNRSKRRRNEKTTKQDFTVFAERRENQRIHISPQLTLATFQYLSTTVDAFKPDVISETILRRLLKQDVIYHIKVKNKEKARSDPHTVIYSQGKAVDYFVLVLEGRVEVTVGRENMMFESGPFTYFGSQALTQNIGLADSPTSPAPQNLGSLQSVNLDTMLRYTFVPDYTVRAITEVFYIKIKRSLYLAAKRATLMELAKKDTQTDDHFDDEVEKLLHSLDEDDRSQGPMDSPTGHQHIQNEKNAVQQLIISPDGGNTDINALPVNKSTSTRSPNSPGGTAVATGLTSKESNGSMKLAKTRSPTKIIGEAADLLLENKGNDKFSNKNNCSKQNTDDSEERTILLPHISCKKC